MQTPDPYAREPHEVEIRFYAELNDFLPADSRQRAFGHVFAGTPSVKDTIEAIGVPHTEVDVILVDDESVGFRIGCAAVNAWPSIPCSNVTTFRR